MTEYTQKTFRTWVQIKRRIAEKEKNLDLIFLYKDIENAYNHYHKSEKLISIELVGWKGESNLDIYKSFKNDFIVKEYIKDKDSGDIEETEHVIPVANVNKLMFILRRYSIGEKIKYRELVSNIISFYQIPVTLDAFNGGKNRALYYFKYYYFPIKILEKLELIHYGGRGDVARLK